VARRNPRHIFFEGILSTDQEPNQRETSTSLLTQTGRRSSKESDACSISFGDRRSEMTYKPMIHLRSISILLATLLTVAGAFAAELHRFSTLVTAQVVHDNLSTDAGLAEAIRWCKQMKVQKVYLETFRNGYQVEEHVLRQAAESLRKAGITVSACVTPTQYGKQAKSPREFHVCHTDPGSQQKAAEIFTFAAKIFDEIMIDDFWSSYCECDVCDTARKARKVKVGDETFDVPGDSWSEYRTLLMRELSRKSVLAPARKANPKVKVILKYPNWYDQFQERGYDVVGQTADFDLVWIGNETREIDNPYHGGIPQYAAYFIQRWMEDIAGEKLGGGWYDAMETKPATYVEQARQTILGGARESVLFSYAPLNPNVGTTREQLRFAASDSEALRKEMPELLEIASRVQSRKAIGIAAYKPAGSVAGDDFHIFDFAGMVGLPLAPCHRFPHDAKAAMFALYGLKDPDFKTNLAKFIKTGRPVLLTQPLADKISPEVNLSATNITILKLDGKARAWMKWDRERLQAMRQPLLRALGTEFDAPAGVALYLFTDGSYVIENFTETSEAVRLDGKEITVPGRDCVSQWKQ
jgi:hypothetical protein